MNKFLKTIEEKRPSRVCIGLRDLTHPEIGRLKAKLEGLGYKVEHKTKGLRFNGILLCRHKTLPTTNKNRN